VRTLPFKTQLERIHEYELAKYEEEEPEKYSQYKNQATSWTTGESLFDSRRKKHISFLLTVQTDSGFHPNEREPVALS
jgi:hypothetical protein